VILQQLLKLRAVGAGARRFAGTALAALAALLLPQAAFASEAVDLKFTTTHYWFLYGSLGFGVVAIIAAYMIAKWVLAQSTGNDKMREVGQAIREGALAYLKRQVQTMLYFIVALAAVLFGVFAFGMDFGVLLGVYVAASFVGGVLASYLAGYAGMLMAVSANMRTAAAALEGPKRALEIAFRSGAVAGLLTVGMGLLGATIIFLLAGNDAMKLLIGFGFGGSLAALFMRVGGGIYTKAADVGADLVGKVEAGIPEDDARNPATIADNVGDNVGDCAGMAADIFESYEVTLVAAIVLGAATAAVFDQATWMKLIIFALMARGVGILASIVGILWVRGNDDVDADALKPIRKGFAVSAFVAAIGTAVLAFLLMGGMGDTIQTTRMARIDEYREKEFEKIRAVRDAIAQEKKVQSWQVTFQDLQGDKRIKDMDLDDDQSAGTLQAAISPFPSNQPEKKELKGFSKLDFDSDNPALDYAVGKPPEGTTQTMTYVTLKERYGTPEEKDKYFVYYVKVTRKAATSPTGEQLPPVDLKGWYGPVTEKMLNDQVDRAKSDNVTVRQRRGRHGDGH
jgi:K(+)-stimulated pyrophosphate-energized sodium pump